MYNIFVCNLKPAVMKYDLNDDEWELIDTIRNYKKTYPLSIELEIYIQQLVDRLMDNDYE